MNGEGRNARFVRTAKRLLLFQVGASALAVGLAGWALIEVAGLVDERDRLAARVAEFEHRAQVDPLYPDAQPPVPDEVMPSPAVPAPTSAPAEIAPAPPPGPPRDSPPPPPPPPPVPDPVPVPPPPPPTPTPPPPPPSPARDCTRADGRAVVCVPPYRRTPVGGICLDGRNRLIRCPPGVRIEPAQEPQDPQGPRNR